jgi:predicted esterase
MKKILFIVSLLLSSFFLLNFCLAQSSKDFGFINHQIVDNKLGIINFYLSDTLHKQKKPLLIYLDGSGNNPLAYFKLDTNGKLLRYSGIPMNIKALKLKYHILLIGKTNVAFAKELSDTSSNNFDSIYNKNNNCDWRVSAASKAIDFVFKNYNVDKTKVIVLGFSEGGQVAPRVAVENKKITHCIAFVGGGLNQFFDEIIKNRMLSVKGDLSQEESQKKIDSLFLDFENIYKNPNSTNLFWFGHPYKRWSSYTLIPTIEYIKKLTIPIYIAQGTEDSNTNVLSSDYTRLEFLRLNKHNLTFKNYAGFDHSFKNSKTGENILIKVMDEAIKWAEKE